MIFLFFAWSKISTILEEKGHSKHPEVERSVFSSEQKSISAGKLLENEKKTKKDFFRNHIKRNATFSHLMLTRKRSNSLKTLKSEQFINLLHTIIEEQDENVIWKLSKRIIYFWICAAGLTCALVAETCWPLTKVRSLCFCSTFFAFLQQQMWFLVTKCSSSAESLKAAGVLSKSTFFRKIRGKFPHTHTKVGNTRTVQKIELVCQAQKWESIYHLIN